MSDLLPAEQKAHDALAELGALAQTPDANIVKLPNISASIPQLKAAIAELQALGFDLPNYPDDPGSEEEQDVKARYDKVKGSAVNPVLREGNSDRRAPRAVKSYAQKHPHRMGAWSSDSLARVASMPEGDFYGSEKSVTVVGPTTVDIVHVDASGKRTVLKRGLALQAEEIIDCAALSMRHLESFLTAEIDRVNKEGALFSLHMKATMMKVSDPIMFGHVVKVYYKDVFSKHADLFSELGIDANNGVLFTESTLKGAHFLELCSQRGIPLEI